MSNDREHGGSEPDGDVMNDLERFLDALPRIDTHCHFEGSLPWLLIRQLHPAGQRLPMTPPWYSRGSFNDFGDFLTIFHDYIRPCLTSLEHYRIAAEKLVELFQKEKNTYTEWNVSISVAEFSGLDPEDVFNVIHSVLLHSFKGRPLPIRLIAGVNRERPLPEKMDIVKRLAGVKAIAGIDVHGWESDDDLAGHDSFFSLVASYHWKVKTHAGELATARNIRTAVEDYGIRHICHGVRAFEDEALLDILLERDVFLEMSLTSNQLLGVLHAGQDYPLRNYLDRGIKVTLNTDDPMIFHTTVHEEFRKAIDLHLSPLDIGVLTLNAVESTLLPPSRKAELQEKVMIALEIFQATRGSSHD